MSVATFPGSGCFAKVAHLRDYVTYGALGGTGYPNWLSSTATEIPIAVSIRANPATMHAPSFKEQPRFYLVDLAVDVVDLAREFRDGDRQVLLGHELIRLRRNLRRERVCLLFAEARRAQLLGDTEGV